MSKKTIVLTVQVDLAEGPACSAADISEAVREFLWGETLEVQGDSDDVSLYDIESVN